MRKYVKKTHYEMTYDEIAKELGVSREAVAEVCRRAEAKVKEALKQKGINPDDLYGEL
jgi:DNA-directed RNA polymerase specialized sigma24 family protein